MKRVAKIVVTVALICVAHSAWSSESGSSVTFTQNKNVGSIHGWTPNPDTIPYFGCSDGSYANAVKNGMIVGAAPIKPYFVVNHGKYSGLDYEVVNAAATYAGIDKVKWKVIPKYSSLIPALLSGKIDMIGTTIHETSKRAKKVGFTSANYWYGPAMAVQKGNPKNISSYSDLINKPNIRIGVLSGSAGATFVTSVQGLEAKQFKNEALMQHAVANDQTDVSIQSEAVAREYLKKKPNANLSILTPPVPRALTNLGFDYSRYIVSKGACSLNLAISRALTDLRQHEVISKILENYPAYHLNMKVAH